ncbi:MAG: hypothetical protein ACE15D_18655 [Candidatus Eisenbacteria bacterium]
MKWTTAQPTEPGMYWGGWFDEYESRRIGPHLFVFRTDPDSFIRCVYKTADRTVRAVHVWSQISEPKIPGRVDVASIDEAIPLFLDAMERDGAPVREGGAA